jgi:hypothetical protein
MQTSSRVVSLDARKSQGHEQHRRDRLVPRRFSAVAKVLWPVKTAACLAVIAKCDERHAKRFLSGEYEPPLSVVLAVIHEMLREQTELNLWGHMTIISIILALFVAGVWLGVALADSSKWPEAITIIALALTVVVANLTIRRMEK